ncbi:hypothetical protein [Clostridium bowmanii]|nr:hypothetical protein [Clostridium bowmanii]
MLKFIIIAIILIMIYIIFAGLMKAAGKDTPTMPDNNHDKDKDN